MVCDSGGTGEALAGMTGTVGTTAGDSAVKPSMFDGGAESLPSGGSPDGTGGSPVLPGMARTTIFTCLGQVTGGAGGVDGTGEREGVESSWVWSRSVVSDTGAGGLALGVSGNSGSRQRFSEDRDLLLIVVPLVLRRAVGMGRRRGRSRCRIFPPPRAVRVRPETADNVVATGGDTVRPVPHA